MELEFRQLNQHACRTYLIRLKNSQQIVLIDPVLEFIQHYQELIARNHFNLTHVIDTHTHADHISASAALKEYFHCDYLMHKTSQVKCVSTHVSESDYYDINGLAITFLHTPGHTKDSMCILLPDRILTGDTLFLDDAGAGRDDLPGGDAGEHWDSLQRILGLPPHLMIYPGHEYRNRQPSTLGQQKQSNPHLKYNDKKLFVAYIDNLQLGAADWMKDVLKANCNCAQETTGTKIPSNTRPCEIGGAQRQDKHMQNMTVGELKADLDNQKDLLLLDVREDHELQSELGHLADIVHIPLGELSHRMSELAANKQAEIVVICRSGGRATTAAEILTQEGFQNVSVLTGGMLAWQAAGYEVER